jgi:hypothetical protein
VASRTLDAMMESIGTLQGSHIGKYYPPNSPSKARSFSKETQGELVIKSYIGFTRFIGNRVTMDYISSHPTYPDQNRKVQ